MPSNKRPFGELFAEPTRNGLTRPKAVRGAGTKMVNMGELFAFPRLRNAPMDRVPLTDEEAEKSLLQDGDLLFARQSLVLEGAGKCSIFLGDDEPVTFESHVTRVRLDTRAADPQFYFYYFQSPHGRAAIRSIVEQGAGAAGIRGSDLKTLEVEWRDVEEQSGVAEILGTLDDKIELNRRMNETLEAIARAIFKSWFVDFDPVRAKASGEPPESICRRLGLTLDLLALFPDRLVDSELGDIPEGWCVTTLGELCERVSMGPFGSDIKTSNFVSEGVPIIRGGNLTSGFIGGKFVFLTESKADELRNANAGAGDIVITHRGTLGQVGLIPENSRYPRYVVSQSQMVLTVKTERTTSRFIYEFLRSPIGQQALLANTSQVGVPAIARPTTSVKAIILVAPPLKLLHAFESVVGSLFARVDAATRESTTLAILRDTLLPKLLSGELKSFSRTEMTEAV
jgi:type I restriction enzyme S subunit